MTYSRVQFDKQPNFSLKTLLGNWYEDRLFYKAEKFEIGTSYARDFNAKELTTNKPSVVWNSKIRDEGLGFFSKLENSEYFHNYSSTYDLAYNHFPRCMPAGAKKNIETKIGEYADSFGNATNTGLKERKQKIWESEVMDPRETSSTNYEQDFMKPTKDCYRFERYPFGKNHYNKYCSPITWECKQKCDQ